MKIRTGFVTNSSSSSFIIVNKTKKEMDLVDFVNENLNMLVKVAEENKIDDSFEDEEDKTLNRTLKKKILDSARENDRSFKPGRPTIIEVSSEDGNLLDCILYCWVGEDGKSKSFEWFAGDD